MMSSQPLSVFLGGALLASCFSIASVHATELVADSMASKVVMITAGESDAATRLSSAQLAELQYHAGMLFNNGIAGATKDPAQALFWFQKSAAGGHPLAAYKLGCYYAGQFPGVIVTDDTQALHFKGIAAEAGYSLAQHDVALLYQKQGDWKRALSWYQKAADQGLFSAMIRLAWLARLQPEADKQLAYQYLLIAQNLQPEQTKAKPEFLQVLDDLQARLSDPQKAAVDQFVRQWRAAPEALSLEAAQGVQRLSALMRSAGQS
ncbi:tetratricopeptide repeat protein [Undibacterium rugosum]|uniref:tetratricopeptide repeat protein n=1 Tax=Undibacterium rugosum TaxID=2762291 RepID=UPI001B8209AF|nr:SEL1-like repeat protein [Undibacterium rugosum]MBR7778991.1 sel1 repeat family protein [Undibacterium rugosum]